MTEKFYTLLTQAGRAKIANSQVTGLKVDLTSMAVGDGKGNYYNPVDTQTSLRNEVWRGNIGSIAVDQQNPNWIVIETIIPATSGGFTVREAGLFDAKGDLIAIGKYPETYKPVLEDGSTKDLYIRMVLEVTNAASVTLKIDPAVTIASQKWVNEKLANLSIPKSSVGLGNVENIKQASKVEFDEFKEDVTSHLAQLAYQVSNENDFRNAITNGHTSISLKKNIILSAPINFDGISIRLNFNGFKIKLSDTYSADYIFSIGYMEDINTQTGVNRTAKNFFNGFIDCNDKSVFVFKYYFSWDFKLNDLRIERCGKGLIGYYSEADSLSTRGAEAVFDNITIIASDKVSEYNTAFDIYFGDSYFTNLFSHNFTYGIIDRAYGNRYNNCHVWGLAVPNAVNQRMAIGYVDKGYNNYFIDCLADTPELLNESSPPSYNNGGIGFYSEYSISSQYLNCEVLLHSSTLDNSIYGWYLNKYSTTSDSYYGDNVVLGHCSIRSNFKKLVKPVYYTGERAITMIGCNFSKNKVIKQYNELNSYSTIYKTPTYTTLDDMGAADLPEKNTYKIVSLNGIMTVINNDNVGNQSYHYIRPHVYNSYNEVSGLKTLQTQLKSEKTKNGSIDRTGTVTTILKKWNATTSKHDLFLVFWDKETEKFYYAKDGAEVIIP